ncbi:hypothetical protein CBL_13783 [Carabus blaptoides fortunei]
MHGNIRKLIDLARGSQSVLDAPLKCWWNVQMNIETDELTEWTDSGRASSLFECRARVNDKDSKNLPRRCEPKNLVELSTELDLYNSYGKTDSKTKLLTLKSMRICESRVGHKIEIGKLGPAQYWNEGCVVDLWASGSVVDGSIGVRGVGHRAMSIRTAVHYARRASAAAHCSPQLASSSDDLARQQLGIAFWIGRTFHNQVNKCYNVFFQLSE